MRLKVGHKYYISGKTQWDEVINELATFHSGYSKISVCDIHNETISSPYCPDSIFFVDGSPIPIVISSCDIHDWNIYEKMR